ncbi:MULTISPECIES: TIR domain-containing protein [Stutzerimonas stutzeri subgroup]|uniref:TIR domain-containing protein n=1 Tax=Stutzerimonas stutzeri subgroup TaxID=578833 RepID=UPI0006865751|nr:MULTISPECIES: TIR domain-containing protein [Stutzerimonas stutzeri subgroup]MCQ2038215.1 TIR domain-containing protein [Stutzerimonas kunmingensis]
MSLRKKKPEIKRLISAFEREADKFHEISFSVFYVTDKGLVDSRRFLSPNHTIMLWQYYGKIEPETGAERFLQNLKDSDLQWGLRGSKLSAFAVVEGETCGLFCRMAKRAGSLFNEKELSKVKSRVIGDILEAEIDGVSTPAAAVNSNEMAIWLNYLLYYISKVNPGKEKGQRIEPDPFSLSLLALEGLLENPEIERVDKSLSKVGEINFKVSLSFPGEHRTFVSKVADILRVNLGKDQVFYDYDYQSQLAVPNLDAVLQSIYRKNSGLVVVFLCKEYAEKEWCGLEWRAVRDIIKCKDDDRIMFIRFDSAEIDGLFSIDGYIDASKFSEEEVARFILERIQLSSNINA